MKFQLALVSLALFFAAGAVNAFMPQGTVKRAPLAAFSLAGVQYFHRFTKDNQHEYTPAGQEDLNAWTDMVTVNVYPNAQSGEALANVANAVLENYKAHQASVIRTTSVPRFRNNPAEHLIVVMFGRPEFLEAVFARFRMHEGLGTAVIYSHRVYGKKIGDEMSAWLKKNGPAVEQNLMAWDAMPKLPPSK